MPNYLPPPMQQPVASWLGTGISRFVVTAYAVGFATVATGAIASVAEAKTTLQILGRPVLTLRHPEDNTDRRARTIADRLEGVLDTIETDTFKVTTKGDAEKAKILLNGRVLVNVALEDAEANSTSKAIAIADVWAKRLRSVLNEPEVKERLLATASMPEAIAIEGRWYVLSPSPAIDDGQFVTDGTRIENRVVFWEGDRPLGAAFPSPPPTEVYLLNRFRRFMPYRTQ